MMNRTFNLTLFGMVLCIFFLLFSVETCKASGNTDSGSLLISLVGGIAVIAVFIMSGIYMYKDAKERDTNGIPWLVIGLLTGLLGLIIWLILRPSYSSKVEHRDKTERPAGITILAVLEMIIGIYTLIIGLSWIFILFILHEMDKPSMLELSGVSQANNSPINSTISLIALGVIVVVITILHFMLAYGFWKGRRWGWGLGIIFPIVGIIGSIILFLVNSELENLVIIIPSVIIGLIILIYLTRPHVKAYFGKS